ncbi:MULTISPECIES: hypothetical protein [unclassified Bacillus (in: firmicutes)]|uniref:hypothetical protein n=1 Tax=unclassified Bacillus (in: firmicutes) TaxID=185979 RepID=UPI00256FD93C|nr:MULTISPECIES: hypothetical protein [unclassified Bacillus (in: firmicutes)]
MEEILNSFDGLEKNFNWLLTDLEWSEPDEYLEYFEDYSQNKFWITGENLKKLADEEGFYLIWGVLSAFDKNEKISLEDIKEEPFADGNPNFWVENPKIQHPKATVELVFWDSSYILLLSKDDDFTIKFRSTYDGCLDLNSYNQS